MIASIIFEESDVEIASTKAPERIILNTSALN